MNKALGAFDPATVDSIAPHSHDERMSQPLSKLVRWFTVGYAPHPEDKSFLARSARQTSDRLAVRVAVLSDRESQRYFGVHLEHRGLQAVWIECDNQSDQPYRLDFYSVDPMYYTPLEAAYVSHFSLGERLLSFGLLSWLFLPLLPLVPFKLASARAANKRMNTLFKRESFRFGPISPLELTGRSNPTRQSSRVNLPEDLSKGETYDTTNSTTHRVPGRDCRLAGCCLVPARQAQHCDHNGRRHRLV